MGRSRILPCVDTNYITLLKRIELVVEHSYHGGCPPLELAKKPWCCQDLQGDCKQCWSRCYKEVLLS